MNYFTYNNIKSNEFNMYFEELPNLPITFNSTGHIVCVLGLKNNIDDLNAIRKWLSNNTGILKFSFDQKIWQVSDVIVTELQRNKSYLKLNIEFFVDVYSITENNENLIFTSKFNEIVVKNPYIVTALPLIEIQGNGKIVININGLNITLNNIKNSIIIDSYIEECFDSAGLRNRDMSGDFPLLLPGNNIISISGTVTKVVIMPRWRW